MRDPLATMTVVFELKQEAPRTWRKLGDTQHLELAHAGRRFVDGVLQEEDAAQRWIRAAPIRQD